MPGSMERLERLVDPERVITLDGPAHKRCKIPVGDAGSICCHVIIHALSIGGRPFDEAARAPAADSRRDTVVLEHLDCRYNPRRDSLMMRKNRSIKVKKAQPDALRAPGCSGQSLLECRGLTTSRQSRRQSERRGCRELPAPGRRRRQPRPWCQQRGQQQESS